MAAQGWWNSARVRACMHKTKHCIEFVVGSQPLLQGCISGSHSNIYVS